ncbi:hypothetical protein [Amycolatopsis minnesotensis]|uniref:hypothetical protein n=1 Tax=Amycolatopsis minnesotensis TaxID=337894 RepID=UPI0031E28202
MARPYRPRYCMPVREQRWRYHLWRLLPRPWRRCGCRYHAGDWTTVNGITLRLLASIEAVD